MPATGVAAVVAAPANIMAAAETSEVRASAQGMSAPAEVAAATAGCMAAAPAPTAAAAVLRIGQRRSGRDRHPDQQGTDGAHDISCGCGHVDVRLGHSSSPRFVQSSILGAPAGN